MFKVESGEVTIKALATTTQEIEGLFDYLKEQYRVMRQSGYVGNDHDPGYHAFIVLKPRWGRVDE